VAAGRLYGRYELLLRNLESQVSSIAGASGSFYAMRARCARRFCRNGADFLSVLSTVEQVLGPLPSRVRLEHVQCQSARGEFRRKVRTLIGA